MRKARTVPLHPFKRVVFPALAILLGLGALELLSRVLLGLVPEPEARTRFLAREVWAHDRNPFHVYDPELFWRPLPGYRGGEVRINRDGFRGAELERGEPAEAIRVVILGDSVAFGFNVREEETFARELERGLNSGRSSPRGEVINAGVIGYTSWQGLKLFERTIQHLRPQVVVVLFGYNDHHSAERSDRERYSSRFLESLVQKLRFSSSMALGLRLRALVSRAPSAPVPRVSVAEFEENLLAIRDLASSEGAESLFLTVPIRPTLPLVENFRLGRYGKEGAVGEGWMRQLDIARGLLGSAGDIVSRHFLASSDPVPFTSDAENCERSAYLSQRYPEMPIFWYLVALCQRARGDVEGAEAAMARCRALDLERREMEAYNERLRELATASRLELIDAAAAFPDDGDAARWFLDVVHPTPAGHERIAGLVQPRIESLRLMSQ